MDSIPYLNAEQMRAVDHAMVETYQITLLQMMENAGRNLAHLARTRFLDGDPRERDVVILAGRGSNGGGGLVCARRLHNWGADVKVLIPYPLETYQGIPAHQLHILQQMAVPIEAEMMRAKLPAAALIVDALIGYSLKGDPHGTVAGLIQSANKHEAPILSLDVPSGLDPTTGTIHTPCIQAAATMTLALPKEGLKGNESAVGELYLADISVPPALYQEADPSLDIGPIFSHDDIIRLK